VQLLLVAMASYGDGFHEQQDRSLLVQGLVSALAAVRYTFQPEDKADRLVGLVRLQTLVGKGGGNGVQRAWAAAALADAAARLPLCSVLLEPAREQHGTEREPGTVPPTPWHYLCSRPFLRRAPVTTRKSVLCCS
jgi:hypothetical protein